MSLIKDMKDSNMKPEINVLSKEVYQDRICQVFREISSALQKSIGPCGAPAVISTMPQYHASKDGYRIMKNIMFEGYERYIDQAIAYMIADICERLNFMVGDGTTSAVIGTDKMFQSFQSNTDKTKSMFFLPRDIIFKMQELKNRICRELDKEAICIKSLDKEQMLNEIRKVVYISSNGDDILTDLIVGMYDKLGYPAIRIAESPDGITRTKYIRGFDFPAGLTDKLYINNDEKTLKADNIDVIIFDHKANSQSFDKIILNLWEEVKRRRRKLLVLAPAYDTVVLSRIIPILSQEYQKFGDLSLILSGYPNSTDHHRKRISDLAVLLNTRIITIDYECKLVDLINHGDVDRPVELQPITTPRLYNLDHRNIPGIYVLDTDTDAQMMAINQGREFNPNVIIYHESALRVGFVKHIEMGLSRSIFDGFFYNENMYKAVLNEAESDYLEIFDKYKITGAFNFGVDEAQERFNTLNLQCGVIEVGASTAFSMGFEKDVVDDAVKAAQSAYTHGIILGEHVTLLKVIDKLISESSDPRDLFLLEVLSSGFTQVNHAILENAFDNKEVLISDTDIKIGDVYEIVAANGSVRVQFENTVAFEEIFKDYDTDYVNLYDLITEYEIYTNTALDLNPEYDTKRCCQIIKFTNAIINSAATDKEILTAAIDLVGLLVTGNQLVVSRPIG